MVRRSATLVIVIIWLAILAMASQSSLIWLDVPFVKQEKNACGAASVSMVMQYWAQQQGKHVSPDADAVVIQRQLYSEKAHGIFASDLQRYVDEHGFRSFVFHGSWEDLQQHIAKGRPLIVAIGESGPHGPLHYVVVAGVDPDRRLVMINDPADRKLMKFEWKDFDRDWALTDHWTLLAIPR